MKTKRLLTKRQLDMMIRTYPPNMRVVRVIKDVLLIMSKPTFRLYRAESASILTEKPVFESVRSVMQRW